MKTGSNNISHSPELRQAVMRVRPDYYALSEKEQELYRAGISSKDSRRIRQSLLKSLLNINVSSLEEMDDVFEDFSFEHHTLINKTILPIMGIGEDNFFLNEGLKKRKTLLNFKTLYDYDYDDFQYQERWRRKECTGHVTPPYTGSLYFTWARLMVDGAFYYADLSSLAPYVISQLEDHADDKIKSLIPYEYVEGKEHGADHKGKGFIFDMRKDAGGMEGQLDELQHRYWQYTSERTRELGEIYHQKNVGQVFIFETNNEGDPQLDFVFSDTKALKAVRFKSFMRDCRAIQSDNQYVIALIEEENKRLMQFLEDSYQDVLKNYDPKVVNLHKKRKIIITEQAAKDLSEIAKS